MNTTSITFCNSSVDQLIDHQSKTIIIESIRQLIDMSPDTKTCKIIRSPRDVSFLKNSHLVALTTRGQRFWFYLTQLNHHNVCLLIEKSIKPGYPFPKMLVVQYKFNDSLHQNTLMEVEVLENAGGCDAPLMLLSDLLVLRNRDIRNWDPIRRFNVLHTILEKQYHENMVIQPCTIHIKRLFASTQWEDMIKYMKTLPYPTRGLFFYPINTRFPPRLWLDDLHELTQSTLPVKYSTTTSHVTSHVPSPHATRHSILSNNSFVMEDNHNNPYDYGSPATKGMYNNTQGLYFPATTDNTFEMSLPPQMSEDNYHMMGHNIASTDVGNSIEENEIDEGAIHVDETVENA